MEYAASTALSCSDAVGNGVDFNGYERTYQHCAYWCAQKAPPSTPCQSFTFDTANKQCCLYAGSQYTASGFTLKTDGAATMILATRMQACAPAERTKTGMTPSTADENDDGDADCTLTEIGAGTTDYNAFEDSMTVAKCDEACAADATCVFFAISTTAATKSAIAFTTCKTYSVSTSFCDWEAEASPGDADEYYLPSKRWCDGAYDPGFKATHDSVIKISPGTKPGETLNAWAAHGSTYTRMSLEYSRIHHAGAFGESSPTTL